MKLVYDKYTAILNATDDNQGQVVKASKGINMVFGYSQEEAHNLKTI